MTPFIQGIQDAAAKLYLAGLTGDMTFSVAEEPYQRLLAECLTFCVYKNEDEHSVRKDAVQVMTPFGTVTVMRAMPTLEEYSKYIEHFPAEPTLAGAALQDEGER